MHTPLPDRLARCCAGLAAWSVAMLPLVAQADWRPDTAMRSRVQSAIGHDAARNQLLLYGGSDSSDFHDTRLWDGASWQLVATSADPGPRHGHLICYDQAQGRLLLYGGQRGTTALNDLWSWNGSGWQPIATPHAPPAANVPMAMVYDSRRQRAVLFGSASYYSDFWEYDGSDWQNVTPASGMPQAGNVAMAFDANAGDVVLFQSADGRSMFTFDGSTVRFTAIAAAPPRPVGFGLVYDSLRHRLVAVGGYYSGSTGPAFALDRVAGTWTQLTLNGPATPVAAPVYDAARDRIAVLAAPSSTAAQHAGGGTWEFNGIAWQPHGGDTPRARQPGDLGWDGSRVVLYGGGSSYDTWQYRDATWTLVVPEPSSPGNTHPGQLSGPVLVRDPLQPELLLFGGRDPSGTGLGCWRLHNDQWSRVNAPHLPPARSEFAIAHDSRRLRLLLFGGQAVSGGPMLNDTWTFDGSDWTQAAPASSPAPRAAHGLAYDPLRDEVVLAGGSSVGGSRTETWRFDGVDWRLAAAAQPFPITYGEKLVWDEARQCVAALLRSPAGDRLELWEWDGSDWRVRPTPTVLPPYAGFGLVATDRDLQTFCGSLGTGQTSDHWFLASPQLASMQPFGSGCSNANGVLTLRGDGLRPWLGGELHLELGPLQTGPLVLPGLWFGWRRDQWQGLPLPIDLAAAGFPGCAVAIAPECPLVILNQGNGTARARLSLPATPALVGAVVFAQGFDFDPFAATLSSSQGLELTLGAR